jgi:Asparagine synthase
MSWRNLLASIFGDFCGGSNCPGVTPTIPAKKADAREFQDCYCARIGLCWAPSSRMIDRISPTIRNEPVTRIQPRPRAKTAMAHRELAVQQRGRIRSFSVDFANYGAAFVASSDFHKASDTPFTRDFVAHVGCDHTEVVLDSRELADRDLRRAVIQAADFPLGTSGDMYSSLYRLFQAVRAESTVALSGESADEVFGGSACAPTGNNRLTPRTRWPRACALDQRLGEGLRDRAGPVVRLAGHPPAKAN